MVLGIADSAWFKSNRKDHLRVRNRIHYTEYVVDIGIVILEEMNKHREDALDCIVIELNPFRTTTGAGLFDWKHDTEQLRKGEVVEIRVHHKPVITDQFVNHYVSESDKYSVEKSWCEILDELERDIGAATRESDVARQKCILL